MFSHITLKEEVLKFSRIDRSHFLLRGDNVSLDFCKGFMEMPVLVGPILKTQQYQIHQEIETFLKIKGLISESSRMQAVVTMGVDVFEGVWRGTSTRLTPFAVYVRARTSGNKHTLEIYRVKE
ncbi:hypothetical protein CF95_gp049 [Erwinia phage PhiEaH1]|uniref:Uncharacterized protein n=1 Tax=Erwinia phage PhiEaH1 TaxID=1401669 RepID=W8CZL2_9CAUD|nr:hypothetical protein CF95_gp049 [Erwinia phage PhiEaH1]AGX01771.1 hypothetical protein [Erwinia phage PhiEaH1]